MTIKPIHTVIDLFCKEKSLDFNKLKFLDVGCGSGDSVKKLLNISIDAYGCDISFKQGENLDFLLMNNRVLHMKLDENKVYRIPYSNNTFDIVYADQVVEHIKDIKSFIKEVFRVLKPSGFFIAYFPSRYKLIEPHVGIPIGGMISQKWYIKLCVLLGLYYRKKYKNSTSITSDIKNYLDDKTFYRSKKNIGLLFREVFSSVSYREDLLLTAMKKRSSANFLTKIPKGIKTYGILWSHCLIAEKASQ